MRSLFTTKRFDPAHPMRPLEEPAVRREQSPEERGGDECVITSSQLQARPPGQRPPSHSYGMTTVNSIEISFRNRTGLSKRLTIHT